MFLGFRRCVLILVCCGTWLSFSSCAVAQGLPNFKIAFVDLEEVSASPRFDSLRKLFLEARETSTARETSLKGLLERIEELESKMQDPSLDPAKLAGFTRAYIQANRELRLQEKPGVSQAKARELELQKTLRREIENLVKVVAVKNNITLVLYRGKEGRMLNMPKEDPLQQPISYSDPALNITKMVLEQLEKNVGAAPAK